jgi:hypothetical protein
MQRLWIIPDIKHLYTSKRIALKRALRALYQISWIHLSLDIIINLE